MSRIFVNFRDTNVLLICKATDLESAGFRRKQGKTCLIPWAMDRNSMYVTSLRETFALYNTYETLDASVIDLTTGSGQVYEDVKTVYVHDKSNAKWIAKNPDKGCWVTEDNRVIVQKGNCYAVQVTSDIETGDTP